MDWLMNRPVYFVLLLATAGFVLVVWLSDVLSKRAEECSGKGGVIVKTLDGWQCVELKVLK